MCRCTFSCAHLQSMIVNIIANYWRMFAIAIMPGMSQADPEYEEYMSKLLSSNRTVAHISAHPSPILLLSIDLVSDHRVRLMLLG